MLSILFDLRKDWVYFRKCAGISLGQSRRDLIAGCEGVTKQVAESGVFRATRVGGARNGPTEISPKPALPPRTLFFELSC
jgi:hypothetical protein